MPTDPARADVDRLVTEHMRRDPDADRAYHHDATYSAQDRWLRGMLRLVDEVMEHEGVPEQVRERVVRCVLYGSPDSSDAVVRITDRARVAATLAAGGPVAPPG